MCPYLIAVCVTTFTVRWVEKTSCLVKSNFHLLTVFDLISSLQRRKGGGGRGGEGRGRGGRRGGRKERRGGRRRESQDYLSSKSMVVLSNNCMSRR